VTEARRISSFEELRPLVRLVGVTTYEVSAKRRDGFDLSHVPVDENKSSELQATVFHDGDNISVRSRIEVSMPKALLVADVGADFRTPVVVEDLESDVVEQLIKLVGLPVVMPNLRAILLQAASLIRVTAPLVQHYWPEDYLQMEIADISRRKSPTVE
jgi:hypothetical protein